MAFKAGRAVGAAIELVEGEMEVERGIRVILTGGHNRGIQIVKMESGGDRALHMVDLLPTHAHVNPLLIMAYDNFPLESIAVKDFWEKRDIEENAWFTFYRDPRRPVRTCRVQPCQFKVSQRNPFCISCSFQQILP